MVADHKPRKSREDVHLQQNRVKSDRISCCLYKDFYYTILQPKSLDTTTSIVDFLEKLWPQSLQDQNVKVDRVALL